MRTRPIIGITIFTLVEVVWIVWLFPSLLQASLLHQLVGFLILETEHVLAFNVGAGRRLLSIPWTA